MIKSSLLFSRRKKTVQKCAARYAFSQNGCIFFCFTGKRLPSVFFPNSQLSYRIPFHLVPLLSLSLFNLAPLGLHGAKWDLGPWPGIEPEPLHCEGGVLTTGPPGKSLSPSLDSASFLFSLCVIASHPTDRLCPQGRNNGCWKLQDYILITFDSEVKEGLPWWSSG